MPRQGPLAGCGALEEGPGFPTGPAAAERGVLEREQKSCKAMRR
jgi:hypothetical protein